MTPHLGKVHVEEVADHSGGVRIKARTTTRAAACPRCGATSERVHERYRRRLQDMSCAGRAVLIVLEVRRFVCVTPSCPAGTFVEQVPDLTERHQHRTPVLRAMLQRIALALAGRAGARLAAVLGIAVSRSTLIRLIRALPDPAVQTVTVLGVDDFARSASVMRAMRLSRISVMRGR